MDGDRPPGGPARLKPRRRHLADIALSRRFEFETLEPRVLMSSDLLPVHGAISVPGQTDRYTFNLVNNTQLYFDSLTPNSNNIDWTLQGPQGTVVNDRSFANSDANGIGGPAALSLVPGNYTLTVAGQTTPPAATPTNCSILPTPRRSRRARRWTAR